MECWSRRFPNLLLDDLEEELALQQQTLSLITLLSGFQVLNGAVHLILNSTGVPLSSLQQVPSVIMLLKSVSMKGQQVRKAAPFHSLRR